MFCTNCGKQTQGSDAFCGGCGNPLLNQTNSVENLVETEPEFIVSSKSPSEVLNQANTVLDEYQSNTFKKSLKSFLNTGFGKERIAESWSQKAFARFEGSAKENSILPREICFAEDTVLFITAQSLFAKGMATALRKSEIQYIDVSIFETNLSLGMAQSTNIYWKLNFITKWAGIAAEESSKGKGLAFNDSTWNFRDGEVSFYLPLGNTNYQMEKYEEMYSEKLDTVAAFYPIRVSNLVITKNRSIGLFVGGGFWNKIGD